MTFSCRAARIFSYCGSISRCITLLLLVLMSLVLLCSPGLAQDIQHLFRNRDWSSIDKMLDQEKENMDSRDLSLVSNAFWLQGRWSDSLPLLIENRGDLPEELKPYQDMLIILGYERTGQYEKALAKALLFLESAPEELRFYVTYAIARMESEDARGRWYLKMLEYAGDNNQRKIALQGLVDITAADPEQCKRLLDLDPSSSSAFELLSSFENAEKEPSFNYYAGIYHYMRQNYSESVRYLSRIEDFTARTDYYLGVAFLKTGDTMGALDAWERGAVLRGWFAEASVRKIAGLYSEYPLRVKEMLQAIYEKVDDDLKPVVLFNLSRCMEGKKKEMIMETILTDFPDSHYAAQILWERGWDLYQQEKLEEALVLWGKGLSADSPDEWRRRFLFWAARINESIGNSIQSNKYSDMLNAEYPLSAYAILSSTDMPFKISEDVPDILESESSLLEDWGFMPYARLALEKENEPSAIMRYSELSSWMGDHYSSYRAASSLRSRVEAMEQGFPRKYLELLYPRPYMVEVERASEETGVDPLLIWSVMKRESAFNAGAVSSAGAKGLMQLMGPTAGDEAKRLGVSEYSLFVPEHNIRFGASHLSWLSKQFEQLSWILAAYNAGSGNLSSWLEDYKDVTTFEFMENIPYRETSEYVRKVMANFKIYKYIYTVEQE